MKQTELIDINNDFTFAVQQAKELFFSGKVFIYPTDTIYGFGANPFNEESAERISEIKGRDTQKNFILLVNDITVLQKYVDIKTENHWDFLLSIWPNPVSIILNLNNETKSILKQETAAFRIPNHRFCLKLLAEIKMPLISTSVNRSGHPPLIDHSSIINEFPREADTIFYYHKKMEFVVSTLIDMTSPDIKILREGKFSTDEIFKRYDSLK